MKGYLAYIDIIGFTNLILSGNSTEFLNKFEGFLKVSTIHDPHLEYLLVSDSIIVTRKTESLKSRDSIFKACSNLFFLLTTNNIPIRGCVTCGDYETKFDSKSKIILGKAYIEALHMERNQNWIGFLISPNVFSGGYDDIKQNQNITCSPDGSISPVGKERMYKVLFPRQKNFVLMVKYRFIRIQNRIQVILRGS